MWPEIISIWRYRSGGLQLNIRSISPASNENTGDEQPLCLMGDVLSAEMCSVLRCAQC